MASQSWAVTRGEVPPLVRPAELPCMMLAGLAGTSLLDGGFAGALLAAWPAVFWRWLPPPEAMPGFLIHLHIDVGRYDIQ